MQTEDAPELTPEFLEDLRRYTEYGVGTRDHGGAAEPLASGGADKPGCDQTPPTFGPSGSTGAECQRRRAAPPLIPGPKLFQNI